MSGINASTLRYYRTFWRNYSQTCEEFYELEVQLHEALDHLEAYPNAQDCLSRAWKKARVNVLEEEQKQWARRVRRGRLFSTFHLKYEVSSLSVRFGTVTYFSNGVRQHTIPFRDTGPRASLLNLIHSARCNWDAYNEDEKQRTIEVLTGCVLTRMRGNRYRQWNDLTTQVAISLLECPAPDFMSLKLACRTPEDDELIQTRLKAVLVMRAELWWDDFVSRCLSDLDKDFRPKTIEKATRSFKTTLEDFETMNFGLFSQIASSFQADPLQEFMAKETIAELLGHFGEKTRNVIRLKSEQHTDAEIAATLRIGKETVKTLLKRTRKKANQAPELVALRQLLKHPEKSF